MKRGHPKLISKGSEPRIVVEEQGTEETILSAQQSIDDESPTINPYFLSPFDRDHRKHSLPTPQCSGITASQVRRLSERGEAAPGPRQAEFLATLSTTPHAAPGGRRHSVVTISKIPQTIFSRNRRESIAGGATTTSFRVLPNRRESIACPLSSESRGSVHNLQLDIMDDIVHARKVRMKCWNTSKEKLCEVQNIDEEGGNMERYASSARRFSDFIGTRLPPIISSIKNKASSLQQKPNSSNTTSSSFSSSKLKSGIVCSNTDLITILCSLSTSDMKLDQLVNKASSSLVQEPSAKGSNKLKGFKSRRSNSFDMSVLRFEDNVLFASSITSNSQKVPSRNPPINKNTDIKSNKVVTDVCRNEPGKVVWDEKHGSLVDASALGSAIEGFLRQTSPDTPKTNSASKIKKSDLKCAGQEFTESLNLEQEEAIKCESSICSTIKDLFIK